MTKLERELLVEQRDMRAQLLEAKAKIGALEMEIECNKILIKNFKAKGEDNDK